VSGEILERVDGKIDPTLEERVVDLPGEEGGTPELCQGDGGTQIAGSLDLDPLGLVPRGAEAAPDPFRLPDCQPAPPRADPDRCAT